MLATLRNALKVKDLRQQLFFTFMMLVVIRLGSQLPCRALIEPTFPAGSQSRVLMHSTFSMPSREVLLSRCLFWL